MASLGIKNGVYHARFRFGEKNYKKSLKTHNKADAEMALHDVERALIGLEQRILAVPPGMDPAEFILMGGRSPQPPSPPHAVAVQVPVSSPASPLVQLPTVRELIDGYLTSQVQKASTTLATERVHLGNLARWLGPRTSLPCDQITADVLNQYLVARSEDCEDPTVEKERCTIILLFRYAVSKKGLPVSPALELPKFQSEVDRSRFKTIAEIKRLIDRGGLDDEEVLDAWECLYLTPEEIAGVLDTVRKNAAEDFAPLLHYIPAYAGLRRGEVLRLKWGDIDFDADEITAWSQKQSRSKKHTKRSIQLHDELKEILLDWQTQRPKGQYVVCEKGASRPLTLAEADSAFRQPLSDTCWCLDRKRRRYAIKFHTYRHSFASNHAARGVPQSILDEWMGHQTEAMRKRYRHLFPKDRKKAIGSFSLASAAAASALS
jgi:integrase